MKEAANGITPALLNKEQAAIYLGVSRATLERLVSLGNIPVVRMPGTGTAGRPRNMYAVAALDRFIDQRSTYLIDEPRQSLRCRTGRKCKTRKTAMQALREAEGQR